ncbi:hypothetical protein [Argonema antarcticum]|uniref:hypothetical protein n=1 Tax=Argonema antarcticum TaxID=2942763 RepID=UPI00201340AC|nr:hypothetical protein [Argonema antarcticum]MCL1470129.1 hypothetical protein [Argonema antarcticum A004/B2]
MVGKLWHVMSRVSGDRTLMSITRFMTGVYWCIDIATASVVKTFLIPETLEEEPLLPLVPSP